MDAVFVRHASRANPLSGPIAGPSMGLASGQTGVPESGLSLRGREEARSLARLLSTAGCPLPVPTQLLASPKQRAIETLAPMSAALGLRLTVAVELDERGDGESALHFEARVRGFVEELDSAFAERDAVWICSHLDWLERAMCYLPSDLSEAELERPFSCAEPRLFGWRDGLWRHAPTATPGAR